MAPKADPKKDAKKKDVKKEKKEVDPDEAKIPLVEQPDKKAFEAEVEKLQGKIDSAQADLKKVKDQIGDRSSGNSDFQTKRSELLTKVNAEKEAIDGYMAKKEEIRGAMGLKNSEDTKMKNDLKDMKKKLGYTDIQQIDQRIKEIEDQMIHSSLTLKDEKKLMLEIAQLKKNKPEVDKLTKMEVANEAKKQLNNNQSLKDQLDQINEVMQVHRNRKKELNEEFTQLLQERDAQMGNSQELYTKRDELNNDIKGFIQQRNELRDGFRQDERKYYEYQKELKNLRWEKQRAEREEREKEWQQERRKRDAEKLDDQPHVAETTLIEQTIKFCKSFQPKEAEEKKEAAATVFDNKKDEVVLVDKSKRDEEFYYAPTRKSKASKAKGKKDGGSAKPIKHNAETFKLFASLKLEAPITTDDIPACLEKLEKLMEEYQGKIKEWEKNRDERKAKILAGEPDPEAEKEEEAEPAKDDDA
jgi:uncharacterized coiled-coil DUF342 family protein